MSSKLVTLPEEKWEELRKSGFFIPKSNFSERKLLASLSFSTLLNAFNTEQKIIFLSYLLDNLSGKKLDKVTLAELGAVCEDNDYHSLSSVLEQLCLYQINVEENGKSVKEKSSKKSPKVEKSTNKIGDYLELNNIKIGEVSK
jgi:hypothetical protein